MRCERALVQGKGDIDPHSHASSPRLCGEKGSSTLYIRLLSVEILSSSDSFFFGGIDSNPVMHIQQDYESQVPSPREGYIQKMTLHCE